MLNQRRIAVVAVITGVGVLGIATPVFADNGWGTVDCDQVPSPACELGAGSGGNPTSTGSNAQHGDSNSGQQGTGAESADRSTESALANCGYQPSDYRPPSGAAGSGAVPDGGVWLDGLCSATGIVETPQYVAALTPAQVAQLARSQLRLPAPDIAASPPEDQLVHLPTWLWLSSDWEPISATASVPGVSVTAVATPVSVVWSMGDGGSVTCAGPGEPFPVGGDPTGSSPTCGYTYRGSSAGERGGTFAVTATLRWSVSWSGGGGSGTFPGMTTESSTAFRVVEAPALNTGSPG